jgi:hypothetical protein
MTVGAPPTSSASIKCGMNVRSPPNCSARSNRRPSTAANLVRFPAPGPGDSDLPHLRQGSRAPEQMCEWCSLPTFAAPLSTVVNPSPGNLDRERCSGERCGVSGRWSRSPSAPGQIPNHAARVVGDTPRVRQTASGDTVRTTDGGIRRTRRGARADGYIVVASAGDRLHAAINGFLPAACPVSSRRVATRFSMAARSCAAAKGHRVEARLTETGEYLVEVVRRAPYQSPVISHVISVSFERATPTLARASCTVARR